jgi:hypothetical protein
MEKLSSLSMIMTVTHKGIHARGMLFSGRDGQEKRLDNACHRAAST